MNKDKIASLIHHVTFISRDLAIDVKSSQEKGYQADLNAFSRHFT